MHGLDRACAGLREEAWQEGCAHYFESDGWRLDCEHGSAVLSKKSGAYPVWGDIYTYWNSESNANSLGAPVGEPREFSTSRGSGWSQDFEQGAIQWNGSDGYVSVLSGAICTEYVPLDELAQGRAAPAIPGLVCFTILATKLARASC